MSKVSKQCKIAPEAAQEAIDHLGRIARELLERVLQKGFYGEARITIKIQDGAVQEVTDSVERKHRLS